MRWFSLPQIHLQGGYERQDSVPCARLIDQSKWMTEELGTIVRRSALPESERTEPALSWSPNASR